MTQLSVLLQSNVISSKYALIASPAFTGIPTAPTPTNSDNSTTLATTAFVKNQNYLSNNQTINVSGDVIGSGSTTLNLTLATTGVAAGTYGDSADIPRITVDSKGRVTSITSIPVITGSNLVLSGDISGTVSSGSLVTTLATVNSNIGTFNNVTVNGKGLVTSASNIAYLTGNQTITVNGDMGGTGTTTLNIILASTGVTPGTYGDASDTPRITVDAKGRVTNITTIPTSGSGSSGSVILTGDISGSGTGTVNTTLATVNSNIGTFNTVTVNAKGQVTNAVNQAYASIDTLDNVVSRGSTTVSPIIITSNQLASSGIVGSTYTNLSGALQVTGGVTFAGNLIVGTSATLGASSAETGPALSLTNPANLYIPANSYTDNTTSLSGVVGHGTVASIFSTTLAATHQYVTYQKASTVYIDSAPRSGTNVTITSPYALYVNNGTSYFAGNAILNGSANTSTTPAQFDNTTKIATTAYVKNNGASYGNLITLSTGTVLDITYAGKLITLTGTAYTTTLPAANTYAAGATLDFFAETTGSSHIAVAGSDVITTTGSSTVTFLNLQNGDSAKLVSNGSNGWLLSGGSIQLQYSPAATAAPYPIITLNTTTTAALQVVDSVDIATYRTVRYMIQITSGSSYQSSDFVVLHDGTNTYNTEYGIVTTSTVLASFDSVISAGSLQLLVTPVNATTTIKVIRIATTI